MIKIDNVEVFGFEHAIRGMRNPLNSWDNSDSILDKELFCIGDKDLRLMKRLSIAGNEHAKYLRMISVYCDINAPLYWWKEFDTYKVGTVANSCSTMHKIHSRDLTLDDFSHEHLFDVTRAALEAQIEFLNECRKHYLETIDKEYWWQIIQLLPTSYNQKRTVMLNYQVLKNMYHSRKNHKLDEWREFCDFIEDLPYSVLITGELTDE